MSDFMRPIPFKNLIEWSLEEYKTKGTVFGVHKQKFYKNTSGKYMLTAFGDKISSPVGPAAGPHSQLAQNIIVSYLAGARFIELKTCQVMDGEQIREAVAKPCILAEDECYNCEWSTELTVPEAYDEYVKAYLAVAVLAKEFGLSDHIDFAYNMSVGYDLEGIKTEKIDSYIEGMKDASKRPEFTENIAYLKENLGQFQNVDASFVEGIPAEICRSITLSTLHGCPANEIERIASYLLTEKKVNTFIKCNPTMLGYEYARATLDSMGYDYIAFTDHHFKADLQYGQAIEMMNRLIPLAKSMDKKFGVKLTNTFPVDVKRGELPSEEMYMAGRSLLPLSISLASKLSDEFGGTLPISYSGGADALNIVDMLAVGIQPITMATTLLKPGGYERFKQLSELCEDLLLDEYKDIDVAKLSQLKEDMLTDARNQKRYRRKIGSRKTETQLPLFDCFKAPCKDGGCPINQQIPEYLKLVSEGQYDKAFEIIAIDNCSPTITGILCSHQCQQKCTRVDYEDTLQIRSMKKIAADEAQVNYTKGIQVADLKTDKKAVVIGAGPAGIAVASFLRRNGMGVVVKERLSEPYGIVRHIIPEFRMPDADIDRDYQMAVARGVEFQFNQDPNYDVEALKKEYDYVILATGAWKKGANPVREGQENITDALDFLWKDRMEGGFSKDAKKIIVVGAGDVAMDCVRVADRMEGVEEACIVYRRTEAYMPASQEEVNDVRDEGIAIHELLAPVSYDGKILRCEKMKLGEYDESGRKSCVGIGEFVEMEADVVVGATGAKVDMTPFEKNGLALTERGWLALSDTLESNLKDVYVAGDCQRGAATVVEAMGDAKLIAKDILQKEGLDHDFVRHTVEESQEAIYAKRGLLEDSVQTKEDGERCLKCDEICEVCVEVCPNRANVMINTDNWNNVHQILHIDGMCNECGNCGVFCPHTGNPYKDKVTLFWTLEDFEDSTNVGFLPVEGNKYKVRTEDGAIVDFEKGQDTVSADLQKMMDIIEKDYSFYLI